MCMGKRVRICKGVFEGTEGVVTEMRHRCRVIILLSATQQNFSLEVDQAEIELLDEGDLSLSLTQGYLPTGDVYGPQRAAL